MVKIPDFKIESKGRRSFIATWTKGASAYHFWIYIGGGGAISTGGHVHSWTNTANGRIHKRLNASVKKWAPIVAAIVDEAASSNSFEQADAEHERIEAIAISDATAAYNRTLVAALDSAIAALPQGTLQRIAEIDDIDERVEIAKAFRLAFDF